MKAVNPITKGIVYTFQFDFSILLPILIKEDAVYSLNRIEWKRKIKYKKSATPATTAAVLYLYIFARMVRVPKVPIVIIMVK